MSMDQNIVHRQAVCQRVEDLERSVCQGRIQEDLVVFSGFLAFQLCFVYFQSPFAIIL